MEISDCLNKNEIEILPRGFVKIFLTKGKHTIIDKTDYDLVKNYRWCSAKRSHLYYALANVPSRTVNGPRQILMHRLLKGVISDEEVYIDHENRNGLDNRRSNLRSTTQSRNVQNRCGRRSTENTSKYKGVSWHKVNKKWVVFIQIDGKNRYVGSYSDEVVAAQAYDVKAFELFGDFAFLNFKQGEIL